MRRPGLAAAAALLTLTLALAGNATGSGDSAPAPAAKATKAPRAFYGVVPQSRLHGEDYERMAAGRVGTVRVTMEWARIDPTPAPADLRWGEFDDIVASASRRGIEVLPTVYTVPGWVTRIEGCSEPEGSGCSITAPRSTIGLAAWRAFVAAAAQRYGPGGAFWEQHPELADRPIRVWQIWNEQNSPGFYKPRPDPGAYADLVQAASEGIRGIDPRAEILLGGMYGDPGGQAAKVISARDFLSSLYRRPGFSAYFDGIAVHPYAGRLPGVKRQVKRLVNVAARFGDPDASLWITELGWASGGDPTARNLGPEGQARRLAQSFRYFTRIREKIDLRLLAWFAWRDVPSSDTDRCYWCAQSGLFGHDALDPKPAWRRFVRFTGGR